MKIHPTALIHSSAEIADDVEIGPYVCIDGHAIIDSGCIIQAHAILAGKVRIGKNNIFGYGAVIGAEPQDHSFHPGIRSEVIIGNNNRIREYCTIHRGTTEGSATTVGNDNFFMAGTHLGHNTTVGNQVIIANSVLLAGHVEVQDRAFIGGGTAFHQFVRVGQVAIAQGNSGFTKDIPPFTIAAMRNSIIGLNVVGLRRAGYSVAQRLEIKNAFKLLYKSGLNTTQAVKRAEHGNWGNEGRIFFDFVASAKKRGICDVRAMHGTSEVAED
jgi:UDP-N-acetylglucosamine acyltransferase